MEKINQQEKTMNIHKIIGIIGLMLVVSLFAYNFNHGERIQYGDGLGWDGAAYADWAQRDSIEILTSQTVSQYYISRMLPSIIIHNISGLVDYDISSTPRVIHAFYIYNFGLLVLIGLLLFLIGKHYKWNLSVYFMAFSALFFNYPILKNFSYNPTLTDVSGYFIGLALFYFYIKDKFTLLVLFSLIGAFVWPTMTYGAIPLIMFGRLKMKDEGPKIHGHILALIIAFSLISLAGYLYFVDGLRQTLGTTPIRESLLPISLTLFIGYIYLALYRLIDVPSALSAVKSVKIYRIAVGVILFFVVRTVTVYFSDGLPGPLTITSYLGLFSQASLANPLVNVVAHAMHYGPFYLVAILLWPKLVSLIKEEGLGLVAFVALFAFLSIGSESRQFINAWPVFAILICEAINRMTRQRTVWFFTYSMVVMGLVLSRFWLTINVGPWTGSFQEFPDQLLFMYSGPWISHQMYEVFLAVTIISLLGVASLLRMNTSSIERVVLKSEQ